MKKIASIILMTFSMSMAQPPQGNAVTPTPEEQQKLHALQGQLQGKIVWSSSRANTHHDLWIMDVSSQDSHALTHGDAVDWFPRFSPDGQSVLFNRSNAGWVSENDADQPQQWDLWTVSLDGTQEKKVVEKATWGTWISHGQAILFSRGAQVWQKDLASGQEKLLLDGELVFKPGVILQEPNMSPDGKFIAITLRGSVRETGIWSIEDKSWQQSGEGCQIDWMPDGKKIYRMNSTGNGGSAAPSEVLWFPFQDGKQVGKVGFFGASSENRLMDLPGRRSHEYFPKVDATGRWLVWAATDKGHDHDIYDYEIYLWKLGSPQGNATRMTFHTGNDRWPDLWVSQQP